MGNMLRWITRGNMLRWIAVGLIGLFVLMQIFSIPVLARQTNPPVVQEPAWDSPETRALAQRACFDCHSNETNWPIYGRIAPISWLVTRDVIAGREELNFSKWGSGEEADEIREVIIEGEMPMPIYLPMHPEARLTEAEKQQLVRGLEASLGVSASSENGEGRASRERGAADETHEDD